MHNTNQKNQLFQRKTLKSYANIIQSCTNIDLFNGSYLSFCCLQFYFRIIVVLLLDATNRYKRIGKYQYFNIEQSKHDEYHSDYSDTQYRSPDSNSNAGEGIK